MTPFKERMNLYRAYRELNPGKNYWDWKQSLEVPAMLNGGNTEDYLPTSEIPTYWDEESQSFKRGMPRVIGMSGTDPIAEAYVTGKAFTKALDIIGDAYRWKSRTDAVNNYRDWLRSSEWNRSSNVSAKLMRERLKAGYREHGGDGSIVSNITNDIANAVQTGVKWGEKLLGFENGGVIPVMQNDGTTLGLRELVINRADSVASNYDDAKDFDLNPFVYTLRKFAKDTIDRGGISNCTLSATGWIDPNNQYMSAKNLFDNPYSGYVEIDKESALPGDLLITKIQQKDLITPC